MQQSDTQAKVEKLERLMDIRNRQVRMKGEANPKLTARIMKLLKELNMIAQ